MRGLMGCSQPDVLAARAMTLNEGNRAGWENYTPLLGNQYSREVGDLGEMNCGLLGTQSTMKMSVNQHLVTADYAVMYPENRFHTLLTEAGQRTRLLVSTHSEILALTLSMVLVTRTQKYSTHMPFAQQRRTSNPTQRWKRTNNTGATTSAAQTTLNLHPWITRGKSHRGDTGSRRGAIQNYTRGGLQAILELPGQLQRQPLWEATIASDSTVGAHMYPEVPHNRMTRGGCQWW